MAFMNQKRQFSIIENISTLIFGSEDFITVFTIHDSSALVEPINTFSKLIGPIFTVDIDCREVIFKVIFTLVDSLPVTIITAIRSRIFLQLSRGKGKWCWWRETLRTRRRNWGWGFLRGGLTPEELLLWRFNLTFTNFKVCPYPLSHRGYVGERSC